MIKITIKYITVLILYIAAFQLNAQNYADTINHIFEHVEKSRITTGLLSDYGVQMVDISGFNGIPTDSNYVDINTWKKLYVGIYTSKINSNIYLDSPDDVDDMISSTTDSPVPLAMMHYSYNKLNDDAVSQGLLQVVNNQIYDVQGAASPYFTRQLFAVAPKMLIFNTSTASFVFNSDLWYSNSGKTIQKLEVNFNNESGYLTANWDTPVSYTFGTDSVKTIFFRLTYTDGSYYTSQTNIRVTSSMQQAPGFLSRRQDISIAATCEHSGGTIQILYSTNNNSNPRKIRKALIVAEGYDPSIIIPKIGNNSILTFTTTYFQYLDKEYPKYGTIDVPYTSGSTLVNMLNSNDYDIVYLDYNNGVDDIKRNAKLLEAAIDTVNKHKEKNDINIVMGISMGGLVARYALRDMELNNREHNTIKFISIDSPHKGANVPVGAQAFVRQVQPLVLLTTLVEVMIGKKLIDEIGYETIQLLNSPATKQLLTYYVAPDFSYDNSVHNSFYTEMESMGFPQKCQNMAVTDGAGNHEKNFNPGSNILNYTYSQQLSYLQNLLVGVIMNGPFGIINLISGKGEVVFNLQLNGLPDKQVQSVYSTSIKIKKKILWFIPVETNISLANLNSTADMVALDGAPGGIYDINSFSSQIPDNLMQYVNQTKFCFIPTTSALCLSNWKDMLNNDLITTNLYANGTCPFEYYFTQTNNRYHTRFNEAAPFLYNHIYTNYSSDVYTQNSTLNTSRYIGGNNIYVGNHVNTNQTSGDVQINNGANVVFEGVSVTLDSGFECTQGSSFEVKIH
jgi:hypothetical protein